MFSDNSRGVLNIRRTQADLKRFPVGTTLVKYTATDKYGNNATCTVKVVVKGILLFAYLFICIFNHFELFSADKLAESERESCVYFPRSVSQYRILFDTYFYLLSNQGLFTPSISINAVTLTILFSLKTMELL